RLAAIVNSHSVTPAQADQVEAADITTCVQKATSTETTVTSNVKGVEYFVEYVRQQLLRSYSADEVLRGGLRVYTSLDPKLQNLAYDTVYTSTLNRTTDPAGALVSLDSDGRVVAMVAGRDW